MSMLNSSAEMVLSLSLSNPLNMRDSMVGVYEGASLFCLQSIGVSPSPLERKRKLSSETSNHEKEYLQSLYPCGTECQGHCEGKKVKVVFHLYVSNARN